MKILSKEKHSAQIQECREKNIVRFDAYYNTVIMSVGLKHIFTDDEPCTFKTSEPSMQTSNNHVTPDVIFQCDNDSRGIVCEIKTSLPDNEQYLLQDMKDQIEKYSDIQSGWKTESKTINQYAILLLLYRNDSKTMDKHLQEWRRSGAIVTNKKICIAEWQHNHPYKVPRRDEILISHRSGTTDCEYFDQKLHNDIKLDELQLTTDYETQKFVKSDPPDLYIMTILYHDLFSTLATDRDEFTVTIDELMKKLAEYYASWSGLEGEQTQIRRRWVTRAMNKFSEMGMAQKHAEQQDTYKIQWSKRIPKNIKEYLLDKMCGKERRAIKDDKQATLDG